MIVTNNYLVSNRWNGLWGPLGIETFIIIASGTGAKRLEWLVGPVRD